MTQQKTSQTGFTIIELLIATTVFSVILLLAMTGFIQIGRFYYKGVTTTRTQEAARTVSEEISRAIQFSATDIFKLDAAGSGNKGMLCMNGTRYSYIIDRQVSNNPSAIPAAHQAYHALVSDPEPNCAPSPTTTAQDISNNGLVSGSRELLGPGMRLSQLSVTPITNTQLYRIKVKVISGDEDLLNNTGLPENATCKGNVVGTQFCAVSYLETTVVRRMP